MVGFIGPQLLTELQERPGGINGAQAGDSLGQTATASPSVTVSTPVSGALAVHLSWDKECQKKAEFCDSLDNLSLIEVMSPLPRFTVACTCTAAETL